MISLSILFEDKISMSMGKYPRENFLDPEIKHLAYSNKPLPIEHEQTTSAPGLIKMVLKVADLNKRKTVLEIGTGSGWQTVLMSDMAKHVYTIEINKGIFDKATERFRRMRVRNITPKFGDGKKGWSQKAPFDVIIVSALVKNTPVIKPWMKQLKHNGVLIVPMLRKGQGQRLLAINRDGIRDLGGVKFVNLR